MAQVALRGDGTFLAIQDGGGGGFPLVLLPGQANSHHWWDGVREDFGRTHRTITFDYRGTGDSAKPEGGYSTQEFAEDAIAVLDALGVERADVYGTSMGGRVAQWLAVRHPERVRRLVLGCTSPGGPHGIERDASVRRMLGQADQQAARKALLDLMYSPAWLATHPGPYQTLGDPAMPPYARRGHLRASDRHDAWEVLPRISAPTLILHGADDRMTPADNVALLASRIPNAKTHIFTGARHAYFEECRPQASDLVAAFLNQE